MYSIIQYRDDPYHWYDLPETLDLEYFSKMMIEEKIF